MHYPLPPNLCDGHESRILKNISKLPMRKSIASDISSEGTKNTGIHFRKWKEFHNLMR